MRNLTIICGGLLSLLGLGCNATTNDVLYEPGQAGTLSIANRTEFTAYLAGCQQFAYQKLVAGQFESQPPDILCIWEGLAVPVPPRSTLELPFTARDPGVWRMRVPLGLGCDPAGPINEASCLLVTEMDSNRYTVREPGPIIEAGCVVSGCSDEICADEPMVSICIALPWAHCFDTATCGHLGVDFTGACAWHPTPELLGCLYDNGWAPPPGVTLP